MTLSSLLIIPRSRNGHRMCIAPAPGQWYVEIKLGTVQIALRELPQTYRPVRYGDKNSRASIVCNPSACTTRKAAVGAAKHPQLGRHISYDYREEFMR